MADFTFSPPSSDAALKSSLAEVLDKHRWDFVDAVTGVRVAVPNIPMCRLVHMEVVRTL